MNKHSILAAVFLFSTMAVLGQAKLRKLATNINHPAINNFAPYISLDGNSLIYLADVAEDHDLTMNYTTRVGVNWKDPVTLPKIVNNHLNFPKGYALSPDGKTLYLSNIRSNGMGGFDLYSSNLKGNVWEEPVNMLLPANSKGNEACPSISLDGSTLFYMRCEKMDFTKAEGCRILMMRKKPNGQWDAPQELPAIINTGNSQTPRIMGDGEILIFSSDRLKPNKGGMDLYFTRLVRGQWGSPQPLDFANTSADDQFVSATAAGMYLLRDSPSQRSSELVEMLFPAEVRPRGTLRVEGTVSGPPDLASPFISVYNPDDQVRSFSTRPEKDGSFVAYMNYGGQYELSIEPAEDNYTFHSQYFDLRKEGNPMVERVKASLSPATEADVIDLGGIWFEPNSTMLARSSGEEIRRLSRLIRANPAKSFAIEVNLHGYLQDSLRSNPDLTEIAYDSTVRSVTHMLDSVLVDSVWVDSVTTVRRDTVIIKSRYHNDRTLKQAKAVEAALIRDGIPQGRLASSGKAFIEAIPEKRRTTVKVIVH